MTAGTSNPFRALIVDDEPLARDLLSAMLSEQNDIQVVGQGSGTQAAALIARTRPDMLFLDIQMPVVDGFTLLREVGPHAVPAVVFVTAYDKYALQAFEFHALDYLLKPVQPVRFADALSRARQRVMHHRQGASDSRLAAFLANPNLAQGNLAKQMPFRQRFLVPERDRMIVVNVDQLEWIEAADYYVSLHVRGASSDHSHLLRETLDEIERQLDPEHFVRVHRSTIVNLACVRELHPGVRGDLTVLLSSGTQVKLSRSRRKAFEERFVAANRR